MEKHTATCISSEPTNREKPDDIISTIADRAVPGDAYKRMCASLYAYRFGTIGFFELLATFEEVLGIKLSQTDFQNAPDAKE